MAERRILNSWKEIANYLGRGVRTVQRWESQLGLPVHRPAGKDHSAVLAFSSELDQWLDSRPVRQNLVSASQLVPSAVPQTSEIQAFLAKAETMLQKIDALVLRSEEAHHLLNLAIEGLSQEPSRRELRSASRVRRTEIGAA